MTINLNRSIPLCEGCAVAPIRPRVQPVTNEDPPAENYTARMSFAREDDPADASRRTRVTLRILLVTLAWAVLAPLLVSYGLTVRPRTETIFTAAALLTVLGPFAVAVMATRNQRFGAGALYIVLTLLMIVPALAIARLG
jgi:hypothetical protein